MEDILIKIVLAIAAMIGAFFWGKSSQKAKQEKRNAKELLKDAEIDNMPDIDNPGDEL